MKKKHIRARHYALSLQAQGAIDSPWGVAQKILSGRPCTEIKNIKCVYIQRACVKGVSSKHSTSRTQAASLARIRWMYCESLQGEQGPLCACTTITIHRKQRGKRQAKSLLSVKEKVEKRIFFHFKQHNNCLPVAKKQNTWTRQKLTPLQYQSLQKIRHHCDRD